MAGEQIRVAGYWLASIGGFGDLTWSTRFERDGAGPYEMSWSMTLPPNFTHPALVGGALTELFIGSSRRWYGKLAEPDRRDGWAFHAQGLAADAEGTVCLNGSGDTTSKPDTAIDQGIARAALDAWTRPNSLSNVAFAATDETDSLNRLRDLLNDWADEEGLTWGVDANGIVFATADPTVPDWYMIPGSGALGVTDQALYTSLFGRYLDSGSSTYETVVVTDEEAEARFGTHEEPVDMTVLGPITAAKATQRLEGKMAKGAARLGWTNDLEPTTWEIFAPGGARADTRFVEAGQLVRLYGVTDESRAVTLTLDVVIGEAIHSASEAPVRLKPKGKAPRNLAEVLTIRPGPIGGFKS